VILLKNGHVKGFSPHINLWLDIKADIEIKIITGEYESGMRIPSITQLSGLYNIGNTTAQKVLEALCEENTIYKRQGVGYFVKPYVRDKLAATHYAVLINRLSDVISYGVSLGYDISKLQDVFTIACNSPKK